MTISHRRVPRVPRSFVLSEVTAAVSQELPPLLVLQAPRGFGKTTTVAHWLRFGGFADMPVAWVSVAQPSPARALWHSIHDTLALEGLTAIAPDPGPAEVRSTLERLDRPLVLVIDGLDQIDDDRVDHDLVNLVQTCDLLNLVVLTRRRRPIAELGPLVVDTRVITERELAFGPAEVRMLASALGRDLLEAEAEELTRALAGWPSLIRGVLLDAARGNEGRLEIDMAAVARFAELAMHDLGTSDWSGVLAALAIPEQFTAAERETLLRGGHEARIAQGLLETPFIVDHGDGRRGVAPTVRSVLRAMLQRDDPDRFRQLSEIVARHRRDDYQSGLALTHAVDAEAWPLALAVLEDNWAELLGSHRESLRAAVHALPTEIVDSSARLVVAREYILDNHMVDSAADAIRSGLLVPDTDLRVRPLTATQKLVLRFDGEPTAGAVDILLGRLDSEQRDRQDALPPHVIRAVPELLTQWGLSMLYDNNGVGAAYGFALACRKAAQAQDWVAAREAATGAGLAMALLGHLGDAEAWLTRGLTFSAEPSALERIAGPIARRAIAALRLADRHSAELELPRMAGEQGLTPLIEVARLATAQRDIFHGEVQRAAHTLRSPGVDAFGTDRPIVVATMAAVHADLALAEGDLDHALQLLTESDDDGPVMRPARARHAFYVGAHREVLRLTEDATDYAGSRPRAGLEMLLVRACTEKRLGHTESAVDLLATAVAIASDSGVLLPFLGVPRADLEEIARGDSYTEGFLASEALAGIRSAFPEPLRAGELSAAELRVLRELAAGSPLAQIGRRLFIAESTVKTHVRRIYRKLGVSSRADAVDRARELSLLT